MTLPSQWKNKIRGTKQIQDGTIEDAQLAGKRLDANPKGLYNGISEDKLNLSVPTAVIMASSLVVDGNRTVVDGTKISFPAIYLRDTVNGKTYKLTTNNGTLVTQEVTI
jgi:hypothetical protein